MRGKRSKQYRKLMQQYSLHFGFREPYQVLIDGAILEDAARFKMDFISGLSKSLHGQIKPMLTTCSIRHLGNRNDQHSIVMEHARNFERRRCNHHELEEPLSEYACMMSVVDPKGTKNNKHKLVVATQNDKLRNALRTIPGVPLIYLKRSVMVMEPMAGATEDVRDRDERSKFRAGIKGSRNPETKVVQGSLKRKRDEELVDQPNSGIDVVDNAAKELGVDADAKSTPKDKKRRKGPKGPNPLSVQKAKGVRQLPPRANLSESAKHRAVEEKDAVVTKKRKRKHKSGQVGTNTISADVEASET